MYLSCLEIDTSAARGRTWLANPYRVHQRLLMAFPDGDAGRVLFRIEAERRPPRIVVQSSRPADWTRAFAEHPVLLGPPLQKEVNPTLRAGQRLRFIVRANPTARRLADRQIGPDGKREMGPRVGLLKEQDQRAWLARKGKAGGFRPLAFEVRPSGQVVFPGGSGDERRLQTHASVDFEGILEVTDPSLFATTLADGVGAAKAFGFGLLLVARA